MDLFGKPFLAASRDGLIIDNFGKRVGLVEVKCPYGKAVNYDKVDPKELIHIFGKFCHSLRDQEMILKKSCDYYFQIQGQLNIVNVD